MKRIGDILTRNKTPVVVEDAVSYKQVTIRTNYKGVTLRCIQDGATIGTKNQFAVSTGQFILSRIDARNGAFGIVPEELEGAIVTNDFLAFDINEDEVEREFFNVFLQSPIFLEACIKASRGNTNRKRVEENFFLNYQIRLPPLTEQHQLIKQINKGRANIGIAQHEITHQQSLLAKLKQAILQEAIQGKLTTDWRAANPDVEPASQLLQRIQAEKNRLITAKKLRPEKPLPKITDEEIPFEIPKGWVWCRMGEAGIFHRGKSKHRPRNDPRLFENGDIPFVQTGDVARSKRNGFMIETCMGYYNEMGLEQSRLWPNGTMCITIAANIAETGFLTFPACIPDSVVAFTPAVEGKTPRFLRMFIELTRTTIEQFAPATAQKNINLEIINQLMLPLPPLAEQAAIVERVEALMATCRALEAEIEQSRAHAAHLLQAVLKEAFSPAS
jgi:type I restriction enzyme S subunit